MLIITQWHKLVVHRYKFSFENYSKSFSWNHQSRAIGEGDIKKNDVRALYLFLNELPRSKTPMVDAAPFSAMVHDLF